MGEGGEEDEGTGVDVMANHTTKAERPNLMIAIMMTHLLARRSEPWKECAKMLMLQLRKLSKLKMALRNDVLARLVETFYLKRNPLNTTLFHSSGGFMLWKTVESPP